jgi:hypothetical protein
MKRAVFVLLAATLLSATAGCCCPGPFYGDGCRGRTPGCGFMPYGYNGSTGSGNWEVKMSSDALRARADQGDSAL